MLDLLNSKKSVLLAQRQQLEQVIAALGQQREQQIANLNATIGAIAAVDELIAEAGQAAIAEAARAVAETPPAPANDRECPPLHKFVPCDTCTRHEICEESGCVGPAQA